MPGTKRTYFVGDAHLGASYIDNPQHHQKLVADMLRSFAADAEAVYLMGDMVDFWFEYRHCVPKGYVRFFGALAYLTDRGIPVYWIKGNHDQWTGSYLTQELGVRVVDNAEVTQIADHNFYIAHGDAMGAPLAYRLLRGIFRNRACRMAARALHPRWLLGAGLAWSAHNRTSRHNVNTGRGVRGHLQFVQSWCAQHPGQWYFVTGHLHQATVQAVDGCDAVYCCVGDAFQNFTYAVFDGSKIQIEQFDTQEA